MAEPASQWAKGENDGGASRGAQVNWRKGESDGGTSPRMQTQTKQTSNNLPNERVLCYLTAVRPSRSQEILSSSLAIV